MHSYKLGFKGFHASSGLDTTGGVQPFEVRFDELNTWRRRRVFARAAAHAAVAGVAPEPLDGAAGSPAGPT